MAEEINRHIREGSIVPVEITVGLIDQVLLSPGAGGRGGPLMPISRARR